MVNLLTTCPLDAPGSMRRCADLIENALRTHAPEIRLRRVDLAPDRRTLSRWPRFLRNRLHHLWVDARLRDRMRDSPDGLFHLLDGSHAYLIRHLPAERTLITCHDLIPLLMSRGKLGPRRPALPARLLIARSAAGLASAAGVLAVSSVAAADARLLAGVAEARLRVVPIPLDERWSAMSGQPRHAPLERDPYILHVGHGGFYKNRPAVLRIFSRIAGEWGGDLVFAGSPLSAEEGRLAAELGVSRRVRSIHAPEDEELGALYRKASLLLFPSLTEGFGWPPLEALACGCPTVASAVGGLPDVLGKASPYLFAPHDEAGMAASALRLLREPDLAHAAVAEGRAALRPLSPQAFAHDMVEEYRSVAGRGPE